MRAFLSWWLRQLGTFVPRALRDGLARPPDALLADVEGDTVRLLVRRSGREIPAGGGTLDRLGPAAAMLDPRARRLPLIVRPGAAVLRKTLGVPAAVGRGLGRLIELEIDRETPFALDEVWWTFATDPPNRAGRVAVRLLVVPRRRLMPALQALEAAGLEPCGLEIEDGTAARFLALDPASRDPYGGHGRGLRVAVCSVAALAAAALALPFVEQARELERQDRTLAGLREQAVAAAEARRRDTDPTGVAALRRHGGLTPDTALDLLARLSDAIPDEAWVQTLELRGHTVRIAGTAASAVRVVQTLADRTRFVEPALTEPIVIDEDRRERFAIAVGMPGDAP
jgi:general secretion pathway protein L